MSKPTITVTVSDLPLDDQFAHAHCEWVPEGTPYETPNTEACERLAYHRVVTMGEKLLNSAVDVCRRHVGEASATEVR